MLLLLAIYLLGLSCSLLNLIRSEDIIRETETSKDSESVYTLQITAIIELPGETDPQPETDTPTTAIRI